MLLSLLAIGLAAPAFSPIAAFPATSWALSYLHYPEGKVPGDMDSATPMPDGTGAIATAWSVVGRDGTFLIVKIEATTALDVVPDTSVIARWKLEPPGVTTTQTTRTDEASPRWEVNSTDSVVGVVSGKALMIGPSQQCGRRTIIGASGSYCVITAAIFIGKTAPLPDSIVLTDVASGTPMFEVLLERDAYRIDPCQVGRCGTFTTVP
ncbi:hypothetical protein [Herbiconiux sp. UC225_62]|uniref:hypothetical protein n=1 Tax=Herbiconiux sp. UC225_62 TaxID=3350168 RepID=UPI0036D269A6